MRQGDFVQRWRARVPRYRPAGETLRPREYGVVELPGDAEAKAFVLAHHYSATYPAARFRFGLVRDEALVGVAVFSHPCNDAVLTSVFEGPALESVELGRFVLLDDVPGNGETWFLGRCFEVLRRRQLRGVLAFSDPQPRHDLEGRVVMPGHLGVIYQAHNGRYLGRGTARRLHLLPNGAVFSARAASKVRRLDTGWQYAVQQLVDAGIPPPADTSDMPGWLAGALVRLRPLKHPGNHRYAWPLHRCVCLPDSLPYPKRGF
ncbi:MAG: hypothetical protein SFW67_17535 [Myxococcaceae bacterium]|nr:hypothetical protein [Myxococcaceae bacterium]